MSDPIDDGADWQQQQIADQEYLTVDQAIRDIDAHLKGRGLHSQAQQIEQMLRDITGCTRSH